MRSLWRVGHIWQGFRRWPGCLVQDVCVTPARRLQRSASPPAMAALVAHTQDALSSPSRLSPELDSIPAKISAYYSLVFPNFTYYLQTLNVTIGRRCIPASAASSSENPQVDVDLGPLKSVSRLHAKIEYEEEEERFVLIVIGRNGAWVDGVWSGSGSKVPLSDRYLLPLIFLAKRPTLL